MFWPGGNAGSIDKSDPALFHGPLQGIFPAGCVRITHCLRWKNSKIGFYQQGSGRDINCNNYWGQTKGYDELVAGGYPISGEAYVIFPNTGGMYFSNNSSLDYNVANMKIDLVRGGTTWNFTFQNKLEAN